MFNVNNLQLLKLILYDNYVYQLKILFIIIIFTVLLTAFFYTLIPIQHTFALRPVSYSSHQSTKLNYSPNEAMQILREKIALNPYELMIYCHDDAHKIGNTAYKFLRERAYTYADPMCGGGYLHGVIEQAFETQGLEYLDSIIHEQCTGDILESCLHGVGHGIHKSNYNLEASIKICSQISASGTDCYDGVFMDVFDTHDTVDVVTFAVQDALTICENTTTEARNSCYFYVPRIIKNSEAKRAIDICSSTDIKYGWAACANGSGVFFMKQTSGFNKQVAISYCALYEDKNLKALCVNGVEAYEKYGNSENTEWD